MVQAHHERTRQNSSSLIHNSIAGVHSLVALLGIFNAVATGAYFSLVSVFPIKTPVRGAGSSGRYNVALRCCADAATFLGSLQIFWAVGQRLSTALILGIQFLLLTPSLSEESENMYYFLSCATVSALGVVMAFILMNLPATSYQLLARDEYVSFLCFVDVVRLCACAVACVFSWLSEFGSECRQIREELEDSGLHVKVSKWELLKTVWPTTLAGGLILFADVAVVTTFTYFPSSLGTALVFVVVSL
jgi:hypothetical protein